MFKRLGINEAGIVADEVELQTLDLKQALAEGIRAADRFARVELWENAQLVARLYREHQIPA